MPVNKFLIKGMANVVLTLAFFYGCGWWLLVGQPERLRAREDPVYAEELFSGLLPVEQVLQSRKWHRRGAEPWDCTYAIVRLQAPVPDQPPTREWQNDLGWQYQFGGDWSPTPAAPLKATTRDALEFCGKYWPTELYTALKYARDSAGSWFDRDRIGETLYLYAPRQRLAARIRFGD
ncbi:hypothetical protein MHM97_03275 [Epibacterium sp. Ofav1-8]|nr:hypothetical protein [Epibacterium sp. Ofav1-8]